MRELFAALAFAGLVGCAGSDLRPSDVERGEARSMQNVQEGTVVDVLDATIRGNTEVAQGVGAASGGYIANRAAKDENAAVQAAATVAGAALGSVAGDMVSNVTMDKAGITILVRVNGRVKAITQQKDRRNNFKPGDTVWIVNTKDGVRVYEQTN